MHAVSWGPLRLDLSTEGCALLVVVNERLEAGLQITAHERLRVMSCSLKPPAVECTTH
jgi:hypothetical protein